MNKAEFAGRYERMFSFHGLSRYNTPQLQEKFYQLTEFMLEKNKRMNLTALRDEKSVLERHILDCLLAANLLPPKGHLLDVGSGGGMPALPFAIIRPDLTITALDATAKKTAYIKDAASYLGLTNVHILTGRAEELAQKPAYRESYDFVCARAVAELRILLEWCIPFLRLSGRFLALKGKNAETELINAETAIQKLSCRLEKDDRVFLHEESEALPIVNERHNLLFLKTQKTNILYPRKNTVIAKHPL